MLLSVLSLGTNQPFLLNNITIQSLPSIVDINCIDSSTEQAVLDTNGAMSHSHAESLLLHQRIRRVRDLLLSANYKDLSTNDELVRAMYDVPDCVLMLHLYICLLYAMHVRMSSKVCTSTLLDKKHRSVSLHS